MASIHDSVRERYADVARGRAASDEAAAGSCCCGSSSAAGTTPEGASDQGSCCGSQSTRFGYTIEELRLLPEGADLALGCGNPTALAGLREGEVVVDLGSGGGIDCFLAAARVGSSGHVIGVDMTAEMIELARANARRAGAENVEFRLGEIEHLPVADATADVIISNCVINLAPDKGPVLREAFRVLRPGGRLLVSDLVLERTLRDDLRRNLALLTGCIAGAMQKESFLNALTEAGFSEVRVESESEYLKHDHLASLAREAGIGEDDAAEIAASLRSVSVAATKPA